MSLLYFWIAVGIIFLIVEILTTSFYGLPLSIAGFVVAIYVWLTGDVSITLLQALIFVLIASFGAFTMPRWISRKISIHKQGMDIYIGKKGKLKKSNSELKVELDGVLYRIDTEDENLKEGDTVRITAHA